MLDSRTAPCAARPRVGAGRRAAGWDGHERTRGSKLHAAVDTPGHLLALRVTAADGDDRAAVAELAEAVLQDATGQSVALADVDQGDTGERPAEAASAHGIALEVVKLPEAKRGFALLPRRWVGSSAPFRLDGALSQVGPGLRAPTRHPGRPALGRLRHSHAATRR